MTLQPSRTLADLLEDHELLRPAWRAAAAAGSFLKDERPVLLHVDTKSSPTDSVTVMDRTAEAMIISLLLGERPDDGLIGEEGGERTGTSGVRWIVDPLDGTVNYLFGLPMWGVSIAAEVEGEVVVGVVATPEFAESYVAVRGRGAWLVVDGSATRLAVRDCDALSDALVTTGFGYSAQMRHRQSDIVTGLIRDIRDVRRLGAAVIDFCWLARGRLDAYYEKGLHSWDYAAGALIAAEAGAVVTGLHDDDLSDFIVAAVPGIASGMRRALAEVEADRV
jgi:myo-inositol-1(or 4)-monophosphatase